VFQGKWFDEVAVGDRFGASVTVTETHLVGKILVASKPRR
jgi:hypothetical protein